ncbi:hypothetical protein Q5A_013880 [Serratia inhibens PRI-2C]|nr:hypothetical protein Q5A_013880 [Serratia inhibens PRI-2C]
MLGVYRLENAAKFRQFADPAAAKLVLRFIVTQTRPDKATHSAPTIRLSDIRQSDDQR